MTPGGAAVFVGVLFKTVEFFDDGEGQDDVVVGKIEQGTGIAQQHISIEQITLSRQGKLLCKDLPEDRELILRRYVGNGFSGRIAEALQRSVRPVEFLPTLTER